MLWVGNGQLMNRPSGAKTTDPNSKNSETFESFQKSKIASSGTSAPSKLDEW